MTVANAPAARVPRRKVRVPDDCEAGTTLAETNVTPAGNWSPVVAVTAETSLPSHGFSRRRILAIDDEALLLKAYRRMLGDMHDVQTAVGAQEALRVLANDRQFDAILCDLQMPDVSGAELYGTVRLRYPALAERFIFVTGGAFSERCQALPRGVGLLGDQQAVPRRGAADDDRGRRSRPRWPPSERAPADPPVAVA